MGNKENGNIVKNEALYLKNDKNIIETEFQAEEIYSLKDYGDGIKGIARQNGIPIYICSHENLDKYFTTVIPETFNYKLIDIKLRVVNTKSMPMLDSLSNECVLEDYGVVFGCDFQLRFYKLPDLIESQIIEQPYKTSWNFYEYKPSILFVSKSQNSKNELLYYKRNKKEQYEEIFSTEIKEPIIMFKSLPGDRLATLDLHSLSIWTFDKTKKSLLLVKKFSDINQNEKFPLGLELIHENLIFCIWDNFIQIIVLNKLKLFTKTCEDHEIKAILNLSNNYFIYIYKLNEDIDYSAKICLIRKKTLEGQFEIDGVLNKNFSSDCHNFIRIQNNDLCYVENNELHLTRIKLDK